MPSSSTLARLASVWRGFWVVAAVALVVRVLYLTQVSSAPLFDRLIMDGAVYDKWARDIAAGDWIGKEVFYQAPLYPYTLGVLKAFGAEGLWPIRILQAVLGSLSCGLLFLVGRSVFSVRAGWIAGLCLAFYPPAVFFDGIIQKASLGGFLVTLFLWLAVRAAQAPSGRRFVATGMALGALMMTREETLLLAPALSAWILVHFRSSSWRERLLNIAAAAAGSAFVLFPVAARNAYVGGEFVLTTSQAGSNFYIGNHAGANGTYTPLRPGRSNTPLERVDARELAELGAGRKLGASEVSSYWFGKSFEWIGEHPGDWAQLLARKTQLLFNAHEIADSEDQAYYAEHSWLLRALAHFFHLGTVLPLAAIGIWWSWRRRDEVGLLLVFFATLCAGVVAFYVFARYRYPIVPFAILFASAGVVSLIDVVRGRRFGQLAVPLVLAAVVAAFSNTNGLSDRSQLAMSYSNAGAVLLDAGEFAKAEAELRRSIELDDDPDTWFNISRALSGQKRLPEAEDALQHSLTARPNDPTYLLERARLKVAQGNLDAAIDSATRSLDAWSKDPAAWAFLGSLHAQRNDWVQVADVSRRALEANPGDLPAALSRAWFLATAPDPRVRNPTEAVRIAESARARSSAEDFRVLDVLAVTYAAAGRTAEAAEQAARAARIAEQAGETALAAQIRAREAQFRKGQFAPR